MNTYNINEVSEENVICIKNNKYDYEFKINLKNRIEKIKNKEYLAEIFTIINNDKKGYMENRYGIFMYIHELSDETYNKLEIHLDNLYYKNKIKQLIY
jgi:hypothetical protein